MAGGMEEALRVVLVVLAHAAATAGAAAAATPDDALIAEAAEAFCAAPMRARAAVMPASVAAALRVAVCESDAARAAARLACSCRAGRRAADAAHSPHDRRCAGARARVCAAFAAWLHSYGFMRRGVGCAALARLCAARAPPCAPSWAALAADAARAERRALARAMRRGMGWLTRFEGRDATRALVADGLKPFDAAPLLALIGTTATEAQADDGECGGQEKAFRGLTLPADALDAFEAAAALFSRE
jgi:hypothetical protein